MAAATRVVGHAVARSRAKRAFDIALASVSLVVLSPVFAIIALAIVLVSGRPVLYAQERVGLDGGWFTMFKFRTMVNGAHESRNELLSSNEAPFPTFKLRRDPRVTGLGRILRMSSLDEIPQLWNILRGDMSFVGPRPALPEEVAHYDHYAMRRLGARPGLTCTWQIAHRLGGQMSFHKWVGLDIHYIENWTFRGDLWLIARTIGVILRFNGT